MNFQNLLFRLKSFFKPIFTISVSVSLTHVKSVTERRWIFHMFQYLRDNFPHAAIIPPDFDLIRWEPIPVENFYTRSERRVKKSDLMIILFYLSEGSDGRGVEVAMREQSGKPMIAFALHGVRISPVMVGCLEKAGVRIITIASYNEMYKHIQAALLKISIWYWILSPFHFVRALFVKPAISSPSP